MRFRTSPALDADAPRFVLEHVPTGTRPRCAGTAGHGSLVSVLVAGNSGAAGVAAPPGARHGATISDSACPALRAVDVVLDGGVHVHLQGEGASCQSPPLWGTTVVEVRAWSRLNPTLRGEAALLPNRDGPAMHGSNVAQRLELAVVRAAAKEPRLLKERVLPRTVRHTSAMHLLQSGVPFHVIALWRGHQSTTTIHRYVEADLAMKKKALARLDAPDTRMRRYRAPDSLMRCLQTL